MPIGAYPYGKQIIPFSATPTFDCTTGNVFKMTLTGNVTSMNLIGPLDGQNITFMFVQDSLGLHSVAWPVNVKGAIPITTLSVGNTVHIQELFYDADSGNFYAVSSGLSGLSL